jgi:periplasmic protein TonB
LCRSIRPSPASLDIHGLVRLEIIVSADGSVSQVKLLTGHPLLAEAATHAVKQWVFQPTLLQGKPIEVRSIIDVNFRLESIFK